VRPVNLIPPEERRGEKAPMRTGPLAYVIVAVLAVALLAVTATILTGNQISDRKAEKASLETQVTQAQAEARQLQSFSDFASLQQARELTVTSLAQSRFDWQRVLHELAIVIPSDVWLTNLNAKASAAAAAPSSSTAGSSSASGVATSVSGPSLDIQGCAAGHDAVASFLAALHDIDGVTRVAVLSSDQPDSSGSASSGTSAAPAAGAAGGAGGATCAARSFISTFEVVAAFDNAQLGATAQPSATTPPATTATASTATASTQTTSSDGTASAADQSQVSDGQQQQKQQADSAAQQTQKAHKAVHTLVPGVGTAP
jgi:Tfp pilus assembly protein PilN